ncbi:hypothetical protein AAHE18_05G225800 [Arachis hypogaea]
MTIADIWSSIECNFSAVHDYCCRKLIRLGCNDYLLIIDFVTIWYMYDFSNVFCCHHTNKESLIYVFIDPGEIMNLEEESFTDPSNHINIVSYVTVKLQINGNFSAKVESKSNLKIGPYEKHYM